VTFLRHVVLLTALPLLLAGCRETVSTPTMVEIAPAQDATQGGSLSTLSQDRPLPTRAPLPRCTTETSGTTTCTICVYPSGSSVTTCRHATAR
jgi:hypothetical protein